MVQLNWPVINWSPSQNALVHATSLEAEFEAIDACVELSVSKNNRLPSSLQKDISKAILKVFADNDYPYESSEADENLIGGLLLKHINAEAAERARDRIPLQLYHDLRSSYHNFVTKLNEQADLSDCGAITSVEERGESNNWEQSPELETMCEVRNSVSLQSEAEQPAAVGNGDDTHEGVGQADLSSEQGRDAIEASIAIDQPKEKRRTRKKRDEVGPANEGNTDSGGGVLEIINNDHMVQEVDVHEGCIDSGVELDDHEDLIEMFKDTEAQRERILLQMQDYESGQLEDSTLRDVVDGLMEDEDMVGKYDVGEEDADIELVEGNTLVNDPSHLAQQPDYRADKQTRWYNNEQFQQEVAGPDGSSLITFNIERQATVNLLDGMGSDGILRRLSSTLETMRSLGHSAPDSIQLTNAMLLDNGDVEVHAHAETKEDMERLSRIRGWDLEFEKSISAPAKSYAVRTSRISVDSLNIRIRKQKAAVIRKLLEENLRFAVSLRSVDDIRDIRWCRGHKKESSLVIEFRTDQQADEVLNSGVFPGAENVKPTVITRDAVLLCVNAEDVHHSIVANASSCPAKEGYKNKLRYTDPSSLAGGTKHDGAAPESRRRTAALSLPSPDSMPASPDEEAGIKSEGNKSIQNAGRVRDHQGCVAALRDASTLAHPQHKPYVKAEGSDKILGIDLAQNQHSNPTLIERRLEAVEKAIEQLSRPQHPQSNRRKRGADEMLRGGQKSFAERQQKFARQSRNDHPMRNRSHLPTHHTDWEVSPYAGVLPGQRSPRQYFLRSL
ncbi:MAG: hypothetical protein ASARMPRED_000353 [Alectoria sarmentosa]|nr:MAG: hypothetical protein ASARMPRED_000353 [Alectoria sarmentosa]